MTEQELMIVENESYVGQPINRQLIVEFGDTLMGVHPNATEIGLQGMRTIAQLALVTGANPLPGTNGIHAWRDKNGKLCFKFGIGYWRTQAEREGGVLWVDKPRPMTESERQYYGIMDKQIASICSGSLKKNTFGLMRDCREFGFEMSLKDAKKEISRAGVGIVNPNEYAKKGRSPQWSADKRAETDLLSQLVPAMSPALQNAREGATVQGGLDWSTGEFAHQQNGEQLADDYGMDDVNGDIFDDDQPLDVDVETGEIIDVTPEPEHKLVDAEPEYTTEPEYTEQEPKVESEPLPDDEQTIVEASAAEFFTVATALIDRFTHENHTKNAAKKLGVTAIPGAPDDRRLLYLRLKEYARARDVEEAEKETAKA